MSRFYYIEDVILSEGILINGETLSISREFAVSGVSEADCDDRSKTQIRQDLIERVWKHVSLKRVDGEIW